MQDYPSRNITVSCHHHFVMQAVFSCRRIPVKAKITDLGIGGIEGYFLGE
ncbi:hypothetical protein [Sporomusa acidovorans]|nr:hypothetical protein [Sporomusa acidovorans]